jgi:hypothetical protein
MGPIAGLDDVEKRKILPLLGLEFRPLGRPAHSQSLYRLRYSGYPILWIRGRNCFRRLYGGEVSLGPRTFRQQIHPKLPISVFKATRRNRVEDGSCTPQMEEADSSERSCWLRILK